MAELHAGMNEIEAGAAMADYIAGAVGEGDGDLDVFDAKQVEPGTTKETPSADSPPEDEPKAADADDGEEEGEAADAATEEQEEDDGNDAQAPIEVATLAEVLGVEADQFVVDDDGQVSLRYQVNGEKGTTTLKDVLASYQLQSHVNQKSEQVSAERKQLHEQVQQREAELSQAIQHAGAFGQAMEQRLLAKYEKVDWDELNASDPGRYAALQVQMSQELQGIRAEVQQVQQTAHAQQQAQQATFDEDRNAWLQEQQRGLVEHLPVMADPEARKPVLQSYHDYLTGYGFATEEISQIVDHRHMRVIDDAVKWRQSQAKVKAAGATPLAEKLERKVPRVAKPGSPRGPKASASDKRSSAFKRLRNSGTDSDAARFADHSGVLDSIL